jgi:hypothetical protein
VRVHHGQPAGGQGEAYVITVLNSSQGPVTVAEVWLQAGLRISISTRPLPVTIGPGEHWETWIEPRELPPGTTGVERLARVGLIDGHVITSKPRDARG